MHRMSAYFLTRADRNETCYRTGLVDSGPFAHVQLGTILLTSRLFSQHHWVGNYSRRTCWKPGFLSKFPVIYSVFGFAIPGHPYGWRNFRWSCGGEMYLLKSCWQRSMALSQKKKQKQTCAKATLAMQIVFVPGKHKVPFLPNDRPNLDAKIQNQNKNLMEMSFC